MTIGVDAIIDRLGGAEAAARLTGVGTEAVRKWRQSGSIPSRHWAAVIAATGLALSDLPGGVSPPRAEPAVGNGDEVPLGATAALVLADGTTFWGRGFGAHTGTARPGGRGLLQHRHDRLSGDADRSVLRRSDHHLHLPAYRQRRHQRRGHRGRHDRGPRSGGEAGHHRTVQLAVGAAPGRLAPGTRDRWRGRGGHAGADGAHPRRRRAERGPSIPRRWPVRPAGVARAGRSVAGPGGHGPRQGGVLPAVLRMGRDAVGVAHGRGSADRTKAPRGRGGLRGEAQHPALPGLGRLPRDRGAGDGDRRRHSAPQAGRRVPVQWPGRSGGDRRICGAGDPRRDGGRRAGVRHLPRAISCWRWRWGRGPTRWIAAIAAPISR